MKSPLSCRNCRMRKKKCDRAFPICYHCLKTRAQCSYQVDRPCGSGSDSGKSVEPASSLVAANNLSWLSVPATVNFLDHGALEKVSAEAPNARIAVGPELRRFVCDDEHLTQHITDYTNTIDHWMPIIRHRNLKKWGSTARNHLHGEEILLLACLKNLVLAPLDNNPATKQYLAIKSAFIGAELSGPVTITTVQAYVLLLLYEFGHGIYPSAYTTLGTCIRYLAVLGIDDTSPPSYKPDTWIELEEQRRLWWAIFAMERAIALGCPQRSLSMKEPDENKKLPSDETSWNQESPPPEPCITLASPAMSNMGNLRLLSHASYLLGRVLQYVSGQTLPEKDRTEQLHKTICALINVLEVENQLGIMTVGVPRSILNSAIFVLYSSAAPIQLDLSSSLIQDPRYLSALNIVERAKVYFNGGLGSLAVAAPFLLNWGFQAFRVYHQIYSQEKNVDNARPLKELGEMFHELDKRWKVAGVYASILNIYQFL
ncbi:hypothetical protein V8C35DRAFT_297877 [Trichoderma chlorosporum]